jgi:hypothetical protein
MHTSEVERSYNEKLSREAMDAKDGKTQGYHI